MAPKGRAEGAGCVFPWKTLRSGRTWRINKKTARRYGRTRDEILLREARNINERRKREAYYVCFIFLDFLSIIPFCILDM